MGRSFSDVSFAVVTGHTVVVTGMISVSTYVVTKDAGHRGTVEGHAMMVTIRVSQIVEVVHSNSVDVKVWRPDGVASYVEEICEFE